MSTVTSLFRGSWRPPRACAALVLAFSIAIPAFDLDAAADASNVGVQLHYLPRVQRVIDAAKVPVVSGTRIVMGPGPAYGGNFSYYDPEHDTIYWIRDYQRRWNSSDLYHELGHAFDRKVLTDEDRERLKKLLGGPPRDWFWGDRSPMDETALPDPYEETFADAYARAASSLRRAKRLRSLLRSFAGRIG